MKLVDRLAIHIDRLEEMGYNIPETSNTKILTTYYGVIGVDSQTSFADWMYGVGKGTYPAYSSVTRAIRLCRVLNSRWSKKSRVKQEQIDGVKEEVGY
jgi:hypothetical protein